MKNGENPNFGFQTPVNTSIFTISNHIRIYILIKHANYIKQTILLSYKKNTWKKIVSENSIK